ncbi:MAG TPA: tetraacyldisaccharide 4'-kinase, partial [Bacteroidia bacterium]|nr:tetraacyldisaccharide 4'-kinase [Bacteroidia bacterium]
VAVAEKRVTGVDALIQKGMQALVLDDAYQHLAVKAGLYILLTDYNNLYCNDYLLPAGNLREWRSAAHRAQIIMVTKCPVDISPADKNKITTALKLQQHQHLFFSSIAYAPILNVLNALPALNNHFADLINYDCLLITGIANPQPLIVYCQKHFAQVHTLTFADHYMFNENDLSQGRKIFDNIANSKKLILTTQKDWMRLQQGHLKIVLNDLPVYVQPISMQIDNIETFNQIIHTYVNSTHTNG